MHLAPDKHGSHGQLLLLAPPRVQVPDSFAGSRTDPRSHEHLLCEMQKFRGRQYVEDGAILPSDLSADGRHEVPVDRRAWHLLALDEQGQICGSVRYVAHHNTVPFSQLGIQRAALARCFEWGTRLRMAVDSEVELARSRGVAYVEVGGWALAPEIRHSVQALRMALATYGLARLLGGCIGITTATERHCSAGILKRIGGAPLALGEDEFPLYYDPQYRCRMQILRFDSTQLNPRFEPWVDELAGYLETAPLIGTVPEKSSRSAGHATGAAWEWGQSLVRAAQ